MAKGCPPSCDHIGLRSPNTAASAACATPKEGSSWYSRRTAGSLCGATSWFWWQRRCADICTPPASAVARSSVNVSKEKNLSSVWETIVHLQKSKGGANR